MSNEIVYDGNKIDGFNKINKNIEKKGDG